MTLPADGISKVLKRAIKSLIVPVFGINENSIHVKKNGFDHCGSGLAELVGCFQWKISADLKEWAEIKFSLFDFIP